MFKIRMAIQIWICSFDAKNLRLTDIAKEPPTIQITAVFFNHPYLHVSLTVLYSIQTNLKRLTVDFT